MASTNRCQAFTLSGMQCKRLVSGEKICYMHAKTKVCKLPKKASPKSSPKKKDPVLAFRDFENQVWEGTYKGTCQTAIGIIKNYVKELYQTKKLPWETKKIKEAPALASVRVYPSEPGTGKGTSQSYKFAKAIYQGKVTCENVSLDQLKLLIHTYVFDQIE